MNNRIFIGIVLIVGMAVGVVFCYSSDNHKLGWDGYFQRFDKPVTNKLLVNYIDRNHEEGKQITVLDLGAGNGGDTLFCLKKGYKVYAVDFQDESIKRIRKNVDIQYQHNLTIIKSRFEEIDWGNMPQFDIIIAFRSISFVAKKDFFLLWDCIYNQLKPNGVVITKLFGDKETRIYHTMTLFDKEEIDQLIKKFQNLYVHEIFLPEKKIRHEFDIIIKK